MLNMKGYMQLGRIQFSCLSYKQVCHAVVRERKKKLVQFSTCFHMLVEGRLVIDFECHWSNTSGWEMASYMHDLVVNKTKSLVEAARFISLSCDEVTTFDQYS